MTILTSLTIKLPLLNVPKPFDIEPSNGGNMRIKVESKNTPDSKDTFYTLETLNWLLRFFNLSYIYRKGNQLKVSWSMIISIIYVFVFGFVNSFLLLTKLERLDIVRSNTSLITFSNIVQMCYLIGYFEYTTDLVFVYKYGRDRFLEYFKCFDLVDQILGMTYYDEIRKIIIRTVRCCMISFCLTSFIDYVCWVVGFGWVSPTLYSLDYFYFFLNMLTVLDGVTHVIQVEYRLKLIKDLLQSYYTTPSTIKSISDDDNNSWTLRTKTGQIPLESLKTLSHGRFIEVIGFNRCYLLLLEQTNYINSKFGYRYLLYCVNLLINMTTLLNVAIRFATGSMVSPNGICRLPSISSIIRLLNWAMVALIKVYRCQSTYKQSEKILEIIDLLLVNKNNSVTLTTTLVDFRNLLISRPIMFHAVHFFTIEYPLLVSVASAVVTYTIILLDTMK